MTTPTWLMYWPPLEVVQCRRAARSTTDAIQAGAIVALEPVPLSLRIVELTARARGRGLAEAANYLTDQRMQTEPSR